MSIYNFRHEITEQKKPQSYVVLTQRSRVRSTVRNLSPENLVLVTSPFIQVT